MVGTASRNGSRASTCHEAMAAGRSEGYQAAAHEPRIDDRHWSEKAAAEKTWGGRELKTISLSRLYEYVVSSKDMRSSISV